MPMAASEAAATTDHTGMIEGTYAMSGVGTRRYMAPEIINGGGRQQHHAAAARWRFLLQRQGGRVQFCARRVGAVDGRQTVRPYTANDHRVIVCQAGERPPLPKLSSSGSRSRSTTNSIHAHRRLGEILGHAWCESVRDRWTMARVRDELTNAVLAVAAPATTTTPVRRRRQPKTIRSQDSPTGVADFVHDTLTAGGALLDSVSSNSSSSDEDDDDSEYGSRVVVVDRVCRSFRPCRRLRWSDNIVDDLWNCVRERFEDSPPAAAFIRRTGKNPRCSVGASSAIPPSWSTTTAA